MTAVLRRLVMMGALVPLAGFVAGCTGADNPKIVEAPAYTPPANPEPPKIPGRTETYGANERYQKAMERQSQR